MSNISFFYESEIDKIKKFDESKIIIWVEKIIKLHNKVCGEINYIFCNDEYLLAINQNSLNHDYYTDIITFDYTEKNIIIGDLFISIERVQDNAINYKQEFDTELKRVIIHGILHLLGFNDKTIDDEKYMREKENEMIKLYHLPI